MSTLADNTETRAFVPGPGGFATSVPPARSAGPRGRDFPVPRPSAGLRLHDGYQGSGSIEPEFIARRGDGRVVRLSELLHLVADAVDAHRDTEQIALRVSARFGREVSEQNVRYLIDQNLIPMGVVVPWDQEVTPWDRQDDEVQAPHADLLLALKGHRVLFGEKRVNRIGRALAWLHRPPIVVLVLLSAVVMDVWLFAFHGAMPPVLDVLNQPVLMLAVFGLMVASLVFHEFGHASACRYGGARPGCIGCGFHLGWPSMYTEVTDVHRIDRPGRIRTGLGGIYFNIVFMLMLTGCYLLTGRPFLLSAVYLGHFELLEQLLPAVRLDGYYILGDLAGVPDLFGKVRPILRGMIPGRPTPPEVRDLKRSARIIVSVWVLTLVPLLLGDLGYALWNLPRLLTTVARSLAEQLTGTGSAFWHGRIAVGLLGVIGSVMLVCPLAGTAYLSIRMSGRLVRMLRRATEGDAMLRFGFYTAAAGLVAGVCFAWTVGLTPKPVPQQPPMVPALQPGVSTVIASPNSSNSPTVTGKPVVGRPPGGAHPGASSSASSTRSAAASAGPGTGIATAKASGLAGIAATSSTTAAPSSSPSAPAGSASSAPPSTPAASTAPSSTGPAAPPASSAPPQTSAAPSGSASS